jgi:hypothetical protein
MGPGGATNLLPDPPIMTNSTPPPISGTVISIGGGSTVIGGGQVIDPRRPVSHLSIQPSLILLLNGGSITRRWSSRLPT